MKSFTTFATAVHSALIIDNSPLEASSLQEVLLNVFDLVDIAHSTEEALQYLQQKPYDVLFFDFITSGDEGLHFLREIRGQGVLSPTVLVGSHVTPDITLEAYKMGVIDFIPKPLTDVTIARIASDVLRRHISPFKKSRSPLNEIKFKINHCLFEEARKDLERYIQMGEREGSVDAHIFLAMTYEILGIFEMAEKAYKKVLKSIHSPIALPTSTSERGGKNERQWLNDEAVCVH